MTNINGYMFRHRAAILGESFRPDEYKPITPV